MIKKFPTKDAVYLYQTMVDSNKQEHLCDFRMMDAALQQMKNNFPFIRELTW